MYRPQWIDLDGVVNMRDLGGLPTESGELVQPRRLLRSDNLQDLSPEAIDTLVTRFGVSDVVDLRTHVELAKEGDGPLRAVVHVRHHHHTLYREDSVESGIPAAERALPWETDERREAAAAAAQASAAGGRADDEHRRSHEQFWSEHYLSYLATRPDSVVAALDAIASSEGAAIVHCAAGKDRTGTVVGLALKVVGVPDDLVIADYAASAERVPAIMARLRSSTAYAANLQDKTVAQQSPTTDTMRLLLQTLDERHGGAIGWLGTQGWTAADTDRLRRKLLGD
ncbi:protein tyrosine/serine phosphatase [Humibacillus xanthopallidus]|uniref:Protein tyrosine/serine phosphatase n=1 Tax=Humibacillus xanthopallidus TaxID=412689 RepID=A0A543PTF5_9MICO|nr:tyrosine-protein phosphatase [Humibacillus xanthopallidus]TQN47351.1 protein tyrosine/serine phosphatase [Humibacillus xanthopallidus]